MSFSGRATVGRPCPDHGDCLEVLGRQDGSESARGTPFVVGEQGGGPAPVLAGYPRGHESDLLPMGLPQPVTDFIGAFSPERCGIPYLGLAVVDPDIAGSL